MPPKKGPAGAGPKRTSTVVKAAEKHLTSAASKKAAVESPTAPAPVAAPSPGPTRVVRRRKEELTPREAPEWQRMILTGAPANSKAKLAAKKGARAKPAPKKPTWRKASRGAAAKKANTKKKSGAGKALDVDDDNEESSAPDSSVSYVPSSSGDESDDSVSFDSDSMASEDPPKRGGKKRRRTCVAASSSSGGSPISAAAAAAVRRPRVRKVLLTCPRCKLQMDEWEYCGLTGDAHEIPRNDEDSNGVKAE